MVAWKKSPALHTNSLAHSPTALALREKARSALSQTVTRLHPQFHAWPPPKAEPSVLTLLRSNELTLAEKTSHFSAALSRVLKEGGLRVKLEGHKTEEMVRLLSEAAQGTQLSASEWQFVRGQLVDVARFVPAAAAVVAPFGCVALVALEKYLPFSLLPSSFSKPVEDVKSALAQHSAENEAHRGWVRKGLQATGHFVSDQFAAVVKRRNEG